VLSLYIQKVAYISNRLYSASTTTKQQRSCWTKLIFFLWGLMVVRKQTHVSYRHPLDWSVKRQEEGTNMSNNYLVGVCTVLFF